MNMKRIRRYEEEDFMLIKDIVFDGNIVDNGWIENLKFDNGKPHMNAIMILSEIVYWYRPTLIRDEETGRVLGYKKKFKADKLQKSYQSLGDRFGITKRQAKMACDFLKDKKIIEIEFRTITLADGTVLNNVMYINLNILNLKRITGIDRICIEVEENQDIDTPPTTECNTPPTTECKSVLQQNVGGSYNEMQERPTTECKTNTEITTKTTTKTTTERKESSLSSEKKDKFLNSIKAEMQEQPFNNFIKKLDIEELENKIILTSPDAVTKTIVENKFSDLIKIHLKKYYDFDSLDFRI